MNYKGHEELKDMNKSELLNRFKDEVYPHRTRGRITFTKKTKTTQRKNWRGGWYDYELTSRFSKETTGTDMSQYRPKIGDTEYTWGELKNYPSAMIRIMLYKYLIDTNPVREEE